MERVEGFFEAKVAELQNTVKSLQWDNAELTKKNGELSERVKELATARNNRRPNRNRRQGESAAVAQLVEQLICNQWVRSSNLLSGTILQESFMIADVLLGVSIICLIVVSILDYRWNRRLENRISELEYKNKHRVFTGGKPTNKLS